MVEERDAESFSADARAGPASRPRTSRRHGEFILAPVRTVAWFHTGYWREARDLYAQYRREWYALDTAAPPLADPTLPDEMSAEEAREAARALKGQILRQEVYAEDGSAVAAFPYAVSARSCDVTLLQRVHRAFGTRAALPPRRQRVLGYPATTTSARSGDHPRVEHTLVLDVDPFGAVLRGPRRLPAQPALRRHGQDRAGGARGHGLRGGRLQQRSVDPRGTGSACPSRSARTSSRDSRLPAPRGSSRFASDVATAARQAPPSSRSPRGAHAGQPCSKAAPEAAPATIYLERRPLGPAAIRHGRVARPPVPELRQGVHPGLPCGRVRRASRYANAMLTEGGYVQLTGD